MEIVETEDGNCYLSQSHALFCEESLGKTDAEMSNFRERVGPRILLLESIDYFGTSNYFSGQKKKGTGKGRRAYNYVSSLKFEFHLQFPFGSLLTELSDSCQSARS